MNGGFELFNGGWKKILHPCGFSKRGGREGGPVKYAAHFTGERGLMADGGGKKRKGEPRSGRSGWRVAGGGMRGRRGFSRRHGEHGGGDGDGDGEDGGLNPNPAFEVNFPG